MISIGLRKGCNDMDQDMLNEVLGSVVAGRPMWKDALAQCAEEGSEKRDEVKRRHDAASKFLNWDSKKKVCLGILSRRCI